MASHRLDAADNAVTDRTTDQPVRAVIEASRNVIMRADHALSELHQSLHELAIFRQRTPCN